jgi:hypothetical protein
MVSASPSISSKAERRSGAEEIRDELAECAGDPSVQVEPRVQMICAPFVICVRMRASSSALSGRSKRDQGPGVCCAIILRPPLLCKV